MAARGRAMIMTPSPRRADGARACRDENVMIIVKRGATSVPG
jgi:hypothetical protein